MHEAAAPETQEAAVRDPLGQLRRWRSLIFWATIALFFLFSAIVQTWPLVLHASDNIINWPHRPEDSWMNLWNLWWVRTALEGADNPFHTDSLFYPQEADLYLHTLATANGVMSIPLQWITGDTILAWNILAIILFALSGLAAFALAHRITHNHAASLIAAYIFAFSPFVMMRLHGHWNIATVWPLPLFALFLIRFQETGRLRDAALAGATWSIITYNSLEYSTDAGVFLGLFLVFWSAVYLAANDRSKRLLTLWRGVPVVVVVWVILASPLLLPAFDSIRNNEVSSAPGGETQVTDPLALLSPSPLWGDGKLPKLPPPGLNHFPPGDIENTVYMGITPLFLAGAGVLTIRRWKDPPVLWLAVFLAFTVLAFGPYLYLGDTKDFSLRSLDFSIPLPYQIYDQLPLLDERRGISRLIVFGHLGLAVLAAIGAKFILDWLGRHNNDYLRRAVPLAGLALLALVVFEYWTPPNAVSRLETPAALQQIGEEPGDFAVIDAPLGRSTWIASGTQAGAIMADYYARIYGKRSFGGYLSRAPDSTVFWIIEPPGIKYIACPACPGLPAADDLDMPRVRALLNQYGVRYIVLHHIAPQGRQVGGEELDRLAVYLRDTLGLTQTHTEPAFTIYRNDEVPADFTRASTPP
jgi:hypothetical protein